MESKIIPSKCITFGIPYFRQNWSFPDSIIHYVTKNPLSPKFYQKMINCCKYFFNKNPIFVIDALVNNDESEWHIADGQLPLDMTNIECKFWINHFFVAMVKSFDKKFLVSSIIPKLYKCDARSLTFENQILTYNDLLVISSSVKYINFFHVNVKNEDDSIVPFEKIVAAFRNVKEIYCEFDKNVPSITSKTFKELLKLPHFLKIKSLKLYCIPQEFDLDAFYLYMTKNQYTKIDLQFSNLSDKYKNQVVKIIDEIIQTKNHSYKPACLWYNGHDIEKYKKLYRIYDSF